MIQFLVIYCDQRYLQFKNSDPNKTLEVVSTPRLISVKPKSDNEESLITVSTLMEGGSINYNADREIIERGDTIVIFPNSVRNTQIVEDYMVVDSIRGVGVVKFVNN